MSVRLYVWNNVEGFSWYLSLMIFFSKICLGNSSLLKYVRNEVIYMKAYVQLCTVMYIMYIYDISLNSC